ARRLDGLAKPNSPLLLVLALTAQHTSVDTATVAKKFQPVMAVTPPGTLDKPIGEKNQAYVGALLKLKDALGQAATAKTGDDPAIASARTALQDAKSAAGQIGLNFAMDAEGRMDGAVSH